MAELVHLRLEHGLRELEEMERIKLFTRAEISKITKKRKLFEYRLRRRNKCKEDFLQYIQFEICLLMLITKRRERLFIELKKQEIDNSIAKKINRLFKAVISRYPEDEKLWLNQIEYFKRMKWNDSLSALYAKLAQVHSNKPELAVMAAKWEAEENNSFSSARKIFQRAVLMNPKSLILWKEFFRLELKYIEMLMKRREILKLDLLSSDTDVENDILGGEILHIVFNKAIEEIPDVEYGLSFLNICFDFDFAAKHADYVLYEIQRIFPPQEEISDAIAKQPLFHLKRKVEMAKKKGLKESDVNRKIFMTIQSSYEEAVSKFPTEKMWSYYLDFLNSKLQACKKETSKNKIRDIILLKMEEAEHSNCLSMKYCIEWINVLKQTDKKKAMFISQAAASRWNNIDIWTECILLHIQNRQSKEFVYQLFNEALETLTGEDSIKIWKLAIDYLTMADPEKLIEFFEKGITKDKKISMLLKEMYLENVALRDGIKEARKLYKRFKTMGTLTPMIHRKMIHIERAQINPSLEHIRACYEDILRDHGHNNVDVWLNFMQFESMYCHNPQAIDLLIWKGKKTLKPELVEEFQSRITKLLTGGQDFTEADFAALEY